MQLSGAYIGDTPLTEIRRGTTLVWSAGVEPPPPTPVAPENTVAPVFLDTTPDAGDVITSASFTLGTWTGTPPPDLSLVFKVNGVPTALPYTVQGGDVLSLTVTGTNEVDSVSVTATTAMATGAIALSLSRIVNAQSLFAPSLLPGGVTATVQRLLNNTAIYAATLIAGMATLSPALLANATTAFVPTLTQASGGVSPDSYNDYQPSPWAASQGMFCPFLLPGKDFDVGAGVIAASPTKAPLSGGQGITSDAEYFYINQTGWYQDYDFYGKRVVITFTCTDMDQVKFVNCRFNNAYVTDSSYFGANTSAGTVLRTDCSFEYCSFDGIVSPNVGGSGECIDNKKGLVGVRRCKFTYWIGDLLNIGGGYFTQNQIELCGNANAVHFDIVNWADISIGPLYYTRNYIDASVAVWPNSNGFNSLVKLVPTNGAGPTHPLLLEENFAWFSQNPGGTSTGNSAYAWIQNIGGSGEFRVLRNYLGMLKGDDDRLVFNDTANIAVQDCRKLAAGNARWDDQFWDGTYRANNDQLVTLPSVPSVTLTQTDSTTVTATFPAPSGATRVEFLYRQIGSDEWLPRTGPLTATSGAGVPNLGPDYEFQYRSVKVSGSRAYVSDWTQKLNTGVSGPVDVTASLARIDNVNTLYAPTFLQAAAIETASSVSKRYWRLEITAWSGNVEASVSELELALLGQTKYTPSSITASSTYSGFPASNAIDGSKSTYWVASNSAQPQRLTLDYGAPVAVNVMRLRGRDGNALTAFKLQHSDDNSTWTTVINASGLSTISEDALKSYPLPGITTGGKILWRLKATAVDGASTTSIAELILRNEPGGAQKATGGRAYAKNIYNGDLTYDAVKAFDGDAATHWNGSDTTGWLAYEFAGSQPLTEVAVRARTTSPDQTPKDFTVEYSADGITWTAADTRVAETGWTAGETRTYVFGTGAQTATVPKLTNANTLYAPTLSLPATGSTLTLTRPGGGYTGNGALSGGDLTWTSGSGYNRVYSSSKKTLGTGKHLIEVQFVTNPGDGDLQIGFADGAGDAPTSWLGGTAKEIGIYQGDGFAYQSSDNAGRGVLTSGFAAGDWIQFALDLTGATPKLWVRKKTGATVSGWNEPIVFQGTQDPAAGSGGATGFSSTMLDYYLCLQGSAAGDVFTVNFGASASQFPAVSGFAAWG